MPRFRWLWATMGSNGHTPKRVQIPIFPPYIEKPRKSMVYGAFPFPVLPSISTQCSGLYGTVLVPDPKLPPWHPKSVSNQTSICGAPAPIPSRRGSGRASSASGIGLSKGGGRVACCCGKTPNTRPFVVSQSFFSGGAAECSSVAHALCNLAGHCCYYALTAECDRC